ncbi:hypothetical protein GCM10011519_07850 [Marmoricola endophyticus]|uniref:Universal stress protein n=1 Tax=Marmoricola endophyticus TaxID=2040280 RepID=A0A917BC84_9ACTN|nr:hypothetical protein [Marmoricola endophyticus]GGF36732.1 hypothetical protein GCM10011519_07850 [Marmoricola endophyticus]
MSTYDVVLLIETGLSELDVRQVRSLHTELPDPVAYHVLLPVDDAAARVEGAVGALGSPAEPVTPSAVYRPEDVADLQQGVEAEARRVLDETVAALRGADGVTADGDLVTVDPIDALATKANEVEAAEVIVLTSPHVVKEFFHVDWASRAERRLDVPVLHLLERETFDQQAERYGDEGVTGY